MEKISFDSLSQKGINISINNYIKKLSFSVFFIFILSILFISYSFNKIFEVLIFLFIYASIFLIINFLYKSNKINIANFINGLTIFFFLFIVSLIVSYIYHLYFFYHFFFHYLIFLTHKRNILLNISF